MDSASRTCDAPEVQAGRRCPGAHLRHGARRCYTRGCVDAADRRRAHRDRSTQLPRTREGWAAQRMVDAVFDDLGGVVTRVGDETVGEMWSLFDGKTVLDEVDPSGPGTSGGTSAARSAATRSTSRPTPIPRGTAPSVPRSKIRTCSFTSCARPTPASSSAAPSSRRPRPTPTRPSPSRRSPTGARTDCPTTPSASSSRWGRAG